MRENQEFCSQDNLSVRFSFRVMYKIEILSTRHPSHLETRGLIQEM